MVKLSKITITKLYFEYESLWQTMQVNASIYPRLAFIGQTIITKNRKRYELGICPFYIVGILHYRESNFNFSTHLHNGDPLTWYTVNEPSGRPKGLKPPFTWEESAKDALLLKSDFFPKDWNDIPRVLYFFEAWNGFGYRLYHPEVLSPYLWSGSNHYIKGKYRSDGKFDPDLADKQIGCAPILYYILNHYN